MAKSTKSRIATGILVSCTTLVCILAMAEIGFRLGGYAESPAMYFDPAVGLRYYPNQTRRMIHGGVDLGEVRTNSWGFRSPEFENKKKDGVTRVVCMGDSFTLGWGVDDSDTWPALLQNQFNQRYGTERIEVINLGQPDFNTVNELRLYRTFVKQLNPDIIVLGYVQNDLAPETLGPVNKAAKLEFIVGSSATMSFLRQNLFGKIGVYQYAHNEGNKERRVRYQAAKKELFTKPDEKLASPFWEVSMEALRQLHEETTEDGTKLLLAVFPLRPQVAGISPSNKNPKAHKRLERTRNYQRRLLRETNEVGLPMLDLLSQFSDAGTDVYSKIDNFHPVALGMQITAESVDKWIVDLGLVAN